MKKFLPIILCLCVVVSGFAACANSKNDNKAEQVTVVVTDANGEAVTNEKGEAVTELVEKTTVVENEETTEKKSFSQRIKDLFRRDKKDDENKEATAVSGEIPTAITTDNAKITEADAINLIESYSAEELGLTEDKRKECKFMVASAGEKIEKNYYVKVIATIATEHKNEETGKSTFTFDNQGEYYIRFDGKQILSKNMDGDDYKELKIKK